MSFMDLSSQIEHVAVRVAQAKLWESGVSGGRKRRQVTGQCSVTAVSQATTVSQATIVSQCHSSVTGHHPVTQAPVTG